ncbi:MAG: sulfite exporter TauE/SafE family protein [Opitutales bacterium]|nr:sulfite exporter TauE/SafE family protein [Opitutales bacterium]
MLLGLPCVVFGSMSYEFWQWLFFGLAAMIIGMSKCGIPGLGILNVVIFQNILLAKDATGFGLPLLIIGDICAMIAYRRHAEWKQIVKLIPWAGLGVIGGFFVLGAIDNVQARLLIGISLVIMIILHVTNDGKSAVVGGGLSTPLMAPIIGAMAGFVSMIANAAGPLMMLYLLAMRMPKMAFMGTSVYFFTLLNLFKVPFLAYLDIVTLESIGANLRLIPLVLGGAFIGYAFARRVNQLWFERTAFWLTIIAVAYMIWNAAKEVINAYG